MNRTTKRSKKSAYLRIAIQILSFFLIPGLFSAGFLALRDLVQAAVSGSSDAFSLRCSVITLLATVPATILFGRWFCGYLCSFGAMQDLLWFVSKKTFKLRHRVPPKLDRALRRSKYILLALIAALLWTGLVSTDLSGPWSVFGQYTDLGSRPGLAPLLSVGGALLILIILASIFIERGFCRYLCPMGAVYAILSKLQRFPVLKKRDACGSCRSCSQSCAMALELGEVDAVHSGECIRCMRCAEICPRGNVRPKGGYLGLIVTLLTVVSCMAYLEFDPAPALDTQSPVTAEEARGPYADGTFTGEGRGYRGTTTVDVTVENGFITDVTVTASGDDKPYLSRVIPVLIPDIIAQQSTDVDVVSGATKSCRGILTAVNDALGITQTPGDAAEDPAQAEKERLERLEAGRLHDLADGQYTGSAEAFRGEVEVLVTVEGQRVTDISIVSYYDHEPYFFQAAPFVIDGIVAEQSLNVDVYTGATYSSNGIIKAVANALSLGEDAYSLAPEKPRAHKDKEQTHVMQKFIESPEQYEAKVEKYSGRDLKP